VIKTQTSKNIENSLSNAGTIRQLHKVNSIHRHHVTELLGQSVGLMINTFHDNNE